MPTTDASTTPTSRDEALDALRAALYSEEIIAALGQIGLDAKDLASGTGADERTVRRWLDGQTPNRSYETALGNLRVVVLYILQRQGLPRDRVAQWLRMPNVELGFETPLAAIEDGRRGDVVVAADAAIAPRPRNALPVTDEQAPGELIDHHEHNDQRASVPASRPGSHQPVGAST